RRNSPRIYATRTACADSRGKKETRGREKIITFLFLRLLTLSVVLAAVIRARSPRSVDPRGNLISPPGPGQCPPPRGSPPPPAAPPPPPPAARSAGEPARPRPLPARPRA